MNCIILLEYIFLSSAPSANSLLGSAMALFSSLHRLLRMATHSLCSHSRSLPCQEFGKEEHRYPVVEVEIQQESQEEAAVSLEVAFLVGEVTDRQHQ